MNAEKLQELVIDKYYSLLESEDFKTMGDHAWPMYCKTQDIKFSEDDDPGDSRVCVENPEYEDRWEQGLEPNCRYVLISKDFAEKCLAMGGLP